MDLELCTRLISTEPFLAFMLALLAMLLLAVVPGVLIWIMVREARPERAGLYKLPILMGIAMFAISLPISLCLKDEANAAKHWPQVAGIVVEDASVSHVRLRHSTTRLLELRYRFTVNGAEYQSGQYKVGGNFLAEGDEYIAGHYPKGTEVTVSYNPANPAESVLNTELNEHNPAMIFVFVSIPWTLFSLLGFYLCKRKQPLTAV